MKRNNMLVLVSTVVFAIAYFIYLKLNWSSISPNFNCITIADVFDNIVTLFIGVVIAFIFGVYYTNKLKQLDVVNKVLDMYLEDLKYIMKRVQNKISECEEFETKQFAKELQHLLKITSNDLNTYIEISKKMNVKEEMLQKYKNSLLEFKISLTNRLFMNLAELSDSYEEITRSYYIIKNDIHLLKLSYYK